MTNGVGRDDLFTSFADANAHSPSPTGTDLAWVFVCWSVYDWLARDGAQLVGVGQVLIEAIEVAKPPQALVAGQQNGVAVMAQKTPDITGRVIMVNGQWPVRRLQADAATPTLILKPAVVLGLRDAVAPHPVVVQRALLAPWVVAAAASRSLPVVRERLHDVACAARLLAIDDDLLKAGLRRSEPSLPKTPVARRLRRVVIAVGMDGPPSHPPTDPSSFPWGLVLPQPPQLRPQRLCRR